MTTCPSSRPIAEWKRKLLICVSRLLLFETLTGLSIYLLPFSLPNQVMVLVHTAIGLVFIGPFAWYQVRHWLRYRPMGLSHIKLTGYFAALAAIAVIASGGVLTFQAVFGTRISYAWDLIHIVATFALIAFVLLTCSSWSFARRGRRPRRQRDRWWGRRSGSVPVRFSSRRRSSPSSPCWPIPTSR